MQMEWFCAVRSFLVFCNIILHTYFPKCCFHRRNWISHFFFGPCSFFFTFCMFKSWLHCYKETVMLLHIEISLFFKLWVYLLYILKVGVVPMQSYSCSARVQKRLICTYGCTLSKTRCWFSRFTKRACQLHRSWQNR